MIFWIPDNRDPASIRKDRRAFRNRVDGVVGALTVHVWSQYFEKWGNCRFGKYRDVVHAAKRRHQFCAFGHFQNWTPRALGRRRVIVIDRNNQPISFQRSCLKIPDVSHVQQIETAVGERHSPPRGAIARHRLDELGFRQYLPHLTTIKSEI